MLFRSARILHAPAHDRDAHCAGSSAWA